MERIKELEEILKDRVATKNGRIVDLNKQLLDCNAEVREGCPPVIPGVHRSSDSGCAKSAAHRDKRREWNVSKQKWNLC